MKWGRHWLTFGDSGRIQVVQNKFRIMGSPFLTNLGVVTISIIAMLSGSSAAADFLQLSNDTTIVISADESWEDQDEAVLHFRGHFEIKAPHWTILADQATVYGALNDPRRVVADGSPVQFFYENSNPENNSVTEGEGQHLEYERTIGLIRLFDDAKITNNQSVIRSSEIQYDLKKQKLQAGGPEGVRITVKPDRLRSP